MSCCGRTEHAERERCEAKLRDAAEFWAEQLRERTAEREKFFRALLALVQYCDETHASDNDAWREAARLVGL